jgi:hypothetical protein
MEVTDMAPAMTHIGGRLKPPCPRRWPSRMNCASSRLR